MTSGFTLFISMSAINNIIIPVLISYGDRKVTFNTFYSNIFAKFRDLKSLTFLFLDLELVLISTQSIIKPES